MLLDWMKNHPTLADDPVSGLDPDAITVSDTVEIAAPARVVWAVLTDMARYNEWNPFCIKAESTLEMGAAVHMKLMNYAVPGSIVPNCEFICANEAERLLSWEMVYSDFWLYPARSDQVI